MSENFNRLISLLPAPREITLATGASLKVLSFHDIIYSLCNSTLQNITSNFPSPSQSEMRVIYGNFNENTDTSIVGSCIADFPIGISQFKKLLKDNIEAGQLVPTIEWLLNTLITEFIENEEYFKSLIPQGRTFDKPDVVVNFSNRGDIFELSIIDVKYGVPATTTRMPTSVASQDEAESAILNNANLPIIRLGHANSFIKNISMTQIVDQYMKAVMVEKMSRDRLIGTRSTLLQSQALHARPTTPLTLPLQGSGEFIGHPGWKPFRAFYFSAGIFIVDAIYKITSVTHKLSPEGFDTQIEFIYH